MVTIPCPRNSEVHDCPNEWLGDDIFWNYMGLPDDTKCSATCEGELIFNIYDDDPSPADVSLSPGSYIIVELDDQTCKCQLTQRELSAAEDEAAEFQYEPDEPDLTGDDYGDIHYN